MPSIKRRHREGAIPLPLIPRAGVAAWGEFEVPNVPSQSGAPYTFPTTLYRFPKFVGVGIDVRDYGATGDGVTDDTTAIKNAIIASRSLGDPAWKARPVYFPDGTYLVSDRLARGGFNDWDNRFWVQGESETGTIIKLKNSCAGYTDAASTKAVIFQTSGASSAFPTGHEAYGNGADGYYNKVCDLTIDLGSGNIGAIGIDALTNNIGGIRRVTIDGTGGGYAGVATTRESLGPLLWHRLTVKGCRYGLDLRGRWSGAIAEHVKLQNQTVAGISIEHQHLTIRGLISTNSVPVVDIRPGVDLSTIIPLPGVPYTGGSSMAGLCLLDGVFTGGSSSVSAIRNRSPGGKVFVRDVTTTGYRAVVDEGSSPVAGTAVTEYATPQTHSLYTVPIRTLRLPVRETPDSPYPTLANTTYVPAPTGGDDTALIQTAIDDCRTSALVFPTRHYHFNGAGQTIHIRGNYVRQLLFSGARFEITGGGYSSAKYVWRVEVPCVIENVGHENWQFGQNWWQLASAGDVVFKSCYVTGLTNVSGVTLGDVFFDDCLVSAATWPNPQNLFARQFNAECAEQTKTGAGDWWVLGWKDECYTTPLTISAGRAELFGVFFTHQSLDVTFGSRPAFVVSNAALSIASCLSSSFNFTYQYWVKETQAPDAARNLTDSSLALRGSGGRWLNLFRTKI